MIIALLTLANTALLIGGLTYLVRVWRNHLNTFFNEPDRQRVEMLIKSVNELMILVTHGVETVDRVEKQAGEVAHDLTNAHIRADAVKLFNPDAPAGTAADELAFSKPKPNSDQFPPSGSIVGPPKEIKPKTE